MADTLIVRRGMNEAYPLEQVDNEGTPLAWPAGEYRAEIRARRSTESELLATFEVDTSNLAGGLIVLRLSNEATETIPADATGGYFDVVRIVSGEPYPVVEPVAVSIRHTITKVVIP